VLRQNLYLFLTLYCSSLIAGELSLLFLAIFSKLSFTAPEPGGVDLLSQLVAWMPFIAETSLYIIPIPTIVLNLVVKIDFKSEDRRKELVKFFFIVFLLLLGLWYFFFMLLMMMYGYGRK
jgi:hypothetical protein